jgi:hypothetical protein
MRPKPVRMTSTAGGAVLPASLATNQAIYKAPKYAPNCKQIKEARRADETRKLIRLPESNGMDAPTL